MIEEQTWDGEVTVRLTANGKLPRKITCPLCGGGMRKLIFRLSPTYRCSPCEATTTLELSKEQKARGIK